MPKIIENLPQRLAEEARRQIEESGFSAMTIRSVASSCGVGIGTVYNYYPSKEALVAAFLLSDWKQCVASIGQCAEESAVPEPVLREMYDQLRLFMDRHASVFLDEAAAASYTGSNSTYHGMLRQQLAEPIRKYCIDDFTASFIAEAMLSWTVSGEAFDNIFALVNKLF